MIPYRKAIYFNCGLNATNLRYEPVRNIVSINKSIGNKEKINLAINSLMFFTDLATKLSTTMSCIMFLFSLSIGLYTTIIYLTYKEVVEGWTTTMFFLSFSFTGLFLLIAILIKYCSLLLSMQLSRQMYIIESVEKQNEWL